MIHEPDNKRKAIFIDKDGTLIPDLPYNADPEKITIEESTIEGLKLLQREGFLIIVISNQSGIAKGFFNEADLADVSRKITELLRPHQIYISGFYYCPHHPDGRIKKYSVECTCRKPHPRLIFKASVKHKIDLSESWMIGDILNDVEAGNLAGCKTVLIDNGNETEWKLSSYRKPTATAENILEAATVILKHEFDYEKY